VCCSVLQCVAVCCSVLQCVAVCCTRSTTSVHDTWNQSNSDTQHPKTKYPEATIGERFRVWLLNIDGVGMRGGFMSSFMFSHATRAPWPPTWFGNENICKKWHRTCHRLKQLFDCARCRYKARGGEGARRCRAPFESDRCWETPKTPGKIGKSSRNAELVAMISNNDPTVRDRHWIVNLWI